jgi:hypothetical protein
MGCKIRIRYSNVLTLILIMSPSILWCHYIWLIAWNCILCTVFTHDSVPNPFVTTQWYLVIMIMMMNDYFFFFFLHSEWCRKDDEEDEVGVHTGWKRYVLPMTSLVCYVLPRMVGLAYLSVYVLLYV